jgi:ribosome-associated toxin RatA of RatAB toxin-antitoxin module
MGAGRLMGVVDRVRIAATPERVFDAAADVERWPDFLGHYRWVRYLERSRERRVVEMAAWRPFPGFKWPTWWVSEMWVDAAQREIRYRHIKGITSGMDVWWKVRESGNISEAEIVHEWSGPAWPLIRRPAADWVIGPIFVHGIASRTLAGIQQLVERA